MALEQGDYIANLIADNPTPDDSTHEGDDHLRLIKKVLKQTFPGEDDAGWSGPLTPPLDFFNDLPTTGIPGLITRTGSDPDEVVSIGLTTDKGTDVYTASSNSFVQNWLDQDQNVISATIANSENLRDMLVNIVYPVGSMLLSGVGDPNERFPGTTWVPVEGRFLVTSGTGAPDENGDTATFNLGDDGGEWVHTLNASELPDHYHRANDIHTKNLIGGNELVEADAGRDVDWAGGADPKQRNTGGLAFNPGDNIGQPHNNTPPYAVIDAWYRTE